MPNIKHKDQDYLEYNFKPDGENDVIFKDIIENLSEDSYLNGLKFRTILFDLKDKLTSFIEEVFSNIQSYLIKLNYQQYEVAHFCYKNISCDRRYHYPQFYSLDRWDSDLWVLATFFSPTLTNPRHTNFQRDVVSLLEILQHFQWFDNNFHSLQALKEFRNEFYGHIPRTGICQADYDRAQPLIDVFEEQLRDNTVKFRVPLQHPSLSLGISFPPRVSYGRI